LPYPELYVLVEGPDDQRFFQSDAIDEVIKTRYRKSHVITWSNEAREDLVSLLNGIIANEGHYIFLLDKNSLFQCLEEVRQYAARRCPSVERDRILVVIREIESWYIAGIDDPFANRYKLAIPGRTETLARPKFKQISKELKFASDVDFMVEILKTFSVERAAERNTSFRRLLEKYLPEPEIPIS
jgi:hypothetical protein